MEHLLLLYFKDKPALLHAYHRLRTILTNLLVLGCICTGILASNGGLRSFSLGLAAGVVLINIGHSLSQLRAADDHNKQVNG